MQAACAAQRDALAIWKRLDVRLAIGRNLRWLSRLAWFVGDRAEADACADEAIDALSAFPDSEELAMAYSNRSQLAMLSRDVDGCLAWGTLALDLARRIGSDDVLMHSLNNVGTARVNAGDLDGMADIEESLAMALADDAHEHVARAFTNLVTSAIHQHRYASARRLVVEERRRARGASERLGAVRPPDAGRMATGSRDLG